MTDKVKRKRGEDDNFPYYAGPLMPLLMVAIVLVLATVPFLLVSSVAASRYWWQYALHDFWIYYYTILAGVMCLLPFVFGIFAVKSFNHRIHGKRTCLWFAPIMIAFLLSIVLSCGIGYSALWAGGTPHPEHVQTVTYEDENYHLNQKFISGSSGVIQGSTIKLYHCDLNDTNCTLSSKFIFFEPIKPSLILENGELFACYAGTLAFLITVPSNYDDAYYGSLLHPTAVVQNHPQCQPTRLSS